jgi:hypothetical protein
VLLLKEAVETADGFSSTRRAIELPECLFKIRGVFRWSFEAFAFGIIIGSAARPRRQQCGGCL